MKRFAWYVVLVFSLLLGGVILWRLSSIVFLFLASLAIAAATRGPIEALMDRRIPRGIALFLVYGLILVIVAAAGFFVYQSLGRELGSITEDLTAVYRTILIRWGGGMVQGLPALSARLPTPEQIGELLAGEELPGMIRKLAGFTSGLANFLTYAGIAFVLSIYWMVDRLRFERLLLSLFPSTRRTRARAIWTGVESGMGAYIRSELVQGFLAAILLAPAFSLMGLRYPVFWALAGALTWFIPLVGALIFLVPLWLIAWVQNGALIATLAVAYSLVVLGFLEFVVERRLYSPEGKNNILVLLVMLAMTDALGMLGLLLAPPFAMAIHILLSQLVSAAATGEQAKPLASGVATLEGRLEEVRAMIDGLDASSTARISNMSNRLRELISQAREVEG